LPFTFFLLLFCHPLQTTPSFACDRPCSPSELGVRFFRRLSLFPSSLSAGNSFLYGVCFFSLLSDPTCFQFPPRQGANFFAFHPPPFPPDRPASTSEKSRAPTSWTSFFLTLLLDELFFLPEPSFDPRFLVIREARKGVLFPLFPDVRYTGLLPLAGFTGLLRP